MESSAAILGVDPPRCSETVKLGFPASSIDVRRFGHAAKKLYRSASRFVDSRSFVEVVVGSRMDHKWSNDKDGVRGGQPRRHLLQSGWSVFVNSKRLVVGDAFIFLRTSTSEFIIPYDQYMEFVKNNYAIGVRFRMRFEGEEAPEQRFTGTIVGSENLDPLWPELSWRSLKGKKT
ncbi:hypothetical protein GUJ93_ZPchr0009g2424 [Zizania palustris]|uniref:Auxin response factor domain-containing protein n=1 Tax=Zizania palustris TaxID=103762 RepID=A0A8J5VN47_ZIZPA|nr:hypothetical protein GUJ93_ZPchr0009g2424 [Zizania palustris]